MEHTYTKVSLRGIRKTLVLGALASSLMAVTLNAKEEQLEDMILLKQAILSLVEKNKALEDRVKLLEQNVFPQNATKGNAKSPYTFEDLVKENAKQKKFTFGKTTQMVAVREQPTTNSRQVFSINAGKKVIVKNIAYSSTGHLWYEIDDGLFVYSKNITFWSEVK